MLRRSIFSAWECWTEHVEKPMIWLCYSRVYGNLWCNKNVKNWVWIFSKMYWYHSLPTTQDKEKCKSKASSSVYCTRKLNKSGKGEPPTTSSSAIVRRPLGRQVVSLGGRAARWQLFLLYHGERRCCVVHAGLGKARDEQRHSNEKDRHIWTFCFCLSLFSHYLMHRLLILFILLVLCVMTG